MSCMIPLNLRYSVTDMESPKHPSHKAWFKSLAILRNLELGAGAPIGARSYCCVDQEDPKIAFYLWEECTEHRFRAIKATCTSETSKLSRRLSPLLEKPLSEDDIWRLENRLRMMHRPDFPYSCLELLFLHNVKRPLWLPRFLDLYTPGGSYDGLYYVPVSEQVYNPLTSANGDFVCFYCIEWSTFERREEVFTSPALSEGMRSIYREEREPILQALGKAEEDLTWEEQLQVFIDCTGMETFRRNFVHATLVDDKYLRLDKRKKSLCVML